MRECCGNCEFNCCGRDRFGNKEYYCNNSESDYYGLETDYTDCCEEFSEKE